MTDELEPAAYIMEHEWITNTARTDGKIAASAPVSKWDSENINSVEPCFAAEDIIQFIDQVAKEQEQGHILQDLDLDEAEATAYEKAVNDLRAILKSRVKRSKTDG